MKLCKMCEQSYHRCQTNLLEHFLNDPRTRNMRNVHRTSVHVAMIVKRGNVIAEARNRIGSRSQGSGYSDFSIHAERNVIKKLGDFSKMRGADMYVMRITKDNEKEGFERLMSSKPCEDCSLFLEKCMRIYGLKNVYYTS